MWIGDALRQLAHYESAACPDDRRRAVQIARAPIEDWRTGKAGRALEHDMAAAMMESGEARVAALLAILRHFDAWLPSLIAAMIGAVETDLDWQPPYNDWKATGQIGLHLVEKSDVRLSLILLQPTPDAMPSRTVRFAAGTALLCPVTTGEKLHLSRWRLTDAGATARCEADPDMVLNIGEVARCDLGRQAFSIVPVARPLAVLRLQLHDEQPCVDRFFDTETGRAVPSHLGSGGLRNHMALSVLTALKPEWAADPLLRAAEASEDAHLAWHYCRLLIQHHPECAINMLQKLQSEGNQPLADLAARTLPILLAQIAPRNRAA